MSIRETLRCQLFLIACTISLVFGQAYDPIEAKTFAALSSVAYCEQVEHVMDWTCDICKEAKTPLVPGKIRIVDGGDFNATRIVIGKLRDQAGCLAAFRGSQNVENWVRNLEFWKATPSTFEDCEGCEVHDGFYSIWKNVRDLVIDGLKEVGCDQSGQDNLLYVTGHSLGAALTHLAMFTLSNAGFKVAKTYSFEAPRVGNKAFSDAFTERFSRQFPVFRITHAQDPVVHLPPEALGFTHVQTEVFYNSDGGHKVCAGVEDTSCADQYWDVPGMLLAHMNDHCHSPLVSNGEFCHPACGNSLEVLV